MSLSSSDSGANILTSRDFIGLTHDSDPIYCGNEKKQQFGS